MSISHLRNGRRRSLMDDLSAQHIEFLKRRRTKSTNTIASRTRVLRSVASAATVTREELEVWWDLRAHLAPGTRAVDLAHLRAFYKWAAMYDHRVDDPSVRLEAPRVPNRIPKRVKRDELEQLLVAVPIDLRRAVMLGVAAGLRISESAALDWDDVDDDEDLITVRASKGDKTRVVPVSPVLIDRIGPRVRGNVLTAGGPQPSASGLQRRLNRAIKAAGLNITTHSLRHRFGMHAYQASDGDILAVAEMMGHESINTTKIYAAAAGDVKRKIAAAVMI